MNWQQVLEDKSLQDIPYKIELNSWGQIVMSPARNKHSETQGQIELLLHRLAPPGRVFPECAIETADNTKVVDVVWISAERFSVLADEDVFHLAPEICVEIKSPWNPWAEMVLKIALYLKAGAKEVWVCDENGEMSFYDNDGKMPASKLVPKFPTRIEI